MFYIFDILENYCASLGRLFHCHQLENVRKMLHWQSFVKKTNVRLFRSTKQSLRRVMEQNLEYRSDPT